MRHKLTKEERLRGAHAGGRAIAKKFAPIDCDHCKMMGYTSWMSHIGHMGFHAVMVNNPAALHSLREKIRGKNRNEMQTL